MQDKVNLVIEKCNNLIREIEILKEEEWLKLKEKDVYYSVRENLLIPDIRKLNISYDKFDSEFENFSGVLMNENQIMNLFSGNVNNPMLEENEKVIIVNNKKYNNLFCTTATGHDKPYLCRNIEDGSICRSSEFCKSNCGIAIPVVNLNKNNNLVELMIKNNFILEKVQGRLLQGFKILTILGKKGMIKISKGKVIAKDKFYDLVNSGKVKEIMGINFKDNKEEKIKNNIEPQGQEIDILKKLKPQPEKYKDIKPVINSNINREQLIEKLLNCEKIRANIEPYDKKIVEDIDRGHWDLWGVELDKNFQLVARNPVVDIVEGGVIGIDFGTKSTIVTRIKNNKIEPLRVGVGEYERKPQMSDYENPTIMYFVDLEQFLKDYRQKEGRPETKWEDLVVSHTAFDRLFEDSYSENYNAFFSDLKQWTVAKNKKIRIKDIKGYEKEIKNYISLDENDFDPIELYAYYIGLYINNMRNGIYMEYVMSFPVTYEKNVREKIIHSFSRGIKRSLPETLLKDNEIMKNFKVVHGVSEPAAYAVCALQEYNFNPQNNERVFYGIFDFGGGTTDFDFGLWTEGKGRRIENTITHFCADGDKYLGGENLLELLAFNMFVNNLDICRENKITFVKPYECDEPAGTEMLIDNNSQSARLNMKRMTEALRPFWERDKRCVEKYESGIIKLSVFNNIGEVISDVEFNIDLEFLEKILEDRIESGVKSFFASLQQSFLEGEDDIKMEKNERMAIFLAGNSSKSPIVRKFFNRYIEEYKENIFGVYKDTYNEEDEENFEQEKINKSGTFIKEEKERNIVEKVKESILKNKNNSKENTNAVFLNKLLEEEKLPYGENKRFKLFPPLGIEASHKIQKELGLDVGTNDILKPTGKTGVAFGLLRCRKGGSIQVVPEDSEEIRFRYYIGYSKKNLFKPIITRNTEYNKWIELYDAGEKDFEFYYSTAPEAALGKMIIGNNAVRVRKNSGVKNADANIYIRVIAPSEIEYVVAKPEDIKNEEYLSEIVKVELM